MTNNKLTMKLVGVFFGGVLGSNSSFLTSVFMVADKENFLKYINEFEYLFLAFPLKSAL